MNSAPGALRRFAAPPVAPGSVNHVLASTLRSWDSWNSGDSGDSGNSRDSCDSCDSCESSSLPSVAAAVLAASSPSAPSSSGRGRFGRRRRCAEFQWFLQALSERPGSDLAISAHLLPILRLQQTMHCEQNTLIPRPHSI